VFYSLLTSENAEAQFARTILHLKILSAKNPIRFTDYEIAHADLEVTICKGAHAAFYKYEDGRELLDYSPAALGLEIVKKEDK
jgi:hypothetical protein